MFHISQLKKAFGECKDNEEWIRFLTENNEWIVVPEEIYGYQKNRKGVWEVLISWKGSPRHEANWENYDDFLQSFPDFHLEDKVKLDREYNVRPPIIYQYSRRKKKIEN